MSQPEKKKVSNLFYTLADLKYVDIYVLEIVELSSWTVECVFVTFNDTTLFLVQCNCYGMVGYEKVRSLVYQEKKVINILCFAVQLCFCHKNCLYKHCKHHIDPSIYFLPPVCTYEIVSNIISIVM